MITDHKGIEYESETAMCKAYGIERTTFRKRIKSGEFTLEQALTEPMRYNRAPWTDEEIAILLKYYPTKGTDIPELNRSASSIMHQARRMNSLNKTQWTKEEDDILKAKFPALGVHIPELKSRSEGSIRARAKRLGLEYIKKDWTEEQICILKEKYPSKGADIPELNKTSSQIRDKASKLGLKNSQRYWSDKEVELLKRFYPTTGYNIPGINRSRDNIQAKAASLGIKKFSKRRDMLGKWVNNKCGLKVRLTKLETDGKKTKADYEFEDGVFISKKYCDPYRIEHPHLSSSRHNRKGSYMGFMTHYIATNTDNDDWIAYYECKCCKCGCKAIMTPQEMIKHNKECEQ